jgi:excisionase family DNA binding protein
LDSQTDKLLSLRDVAQRTGMSLSAVEAWVARGALRSVQVVPRGRHLVHESDLEEVLRPRTRS